VSKHPDKNGFRKLKNGALSIRPAAAREQRKERREKWRPPQVFPGIKTKSEDD